MPIKGVQKKIDWTPEDRARHRQIRERFQSKPSLESLVASGELSGHPVPLGTWLSLRGFLHSLRSIRESAGLSLSELSQRSGMDKAALSRLENGHVPNAGIETVTRYLAALGKEIEWRIVDDSRKTSAKGS